MGYHPRPQSTMVATKVLISLCEYGLAAAAPQLGQNLNQEVIVNDVVTALQPSIAEAVANALRGLSTSAVLPASTGSAGFSGSSSSTKSGFSSTGFSSNSGSATGSASRFAAGGASSFGANSGSAAGFGVSSGSAGFGASSGSAAKSGSASGFAANSGSASGVVTKSGSASVFGANSGAASGFAANSGSASGFAAGRTSSNTAAVKAAAEDEMEIMTRPEYNYQFNVADDEFQTYINQQENRDGEAVVGTYSYVDPLGALITVNYQAGPDGYTQTAETEEGFVTISEENKARMKSAAVAGNAAAALSVLSSSSAAGSAGKFAAGVAADSVSKFSSAGASASRYAAGGAATGSASKFAAGGSATKFAAGGGSASRFAAGGATSSSFGSGNAFGSNSAGQKFSTVTTTTSGLDQEALIAQILAVLQPQISSAVNTAVRQQQSTTTTSSRGQTALTGLSFANRQTGFLDVSQQVTGDRLTPLFGN